jgi:hypothetical protein
MEEALLPRVQRLRLKGAGTEELRAAQEAWKRALAANDAWNEDFWKEHAWELDAERYEDLHRAYRDAWKDFDWQSFAPHAEVWLRWPGCEDSKCVPAPLPAPKSAPAPMPEPPSDPAPRAPAGDGVV